MARVFGNIGEFPDYKPVKIFSNSSTFSRVHKKEACAIHLARIVNEEELDTITRVEIRQAENYGIEKPYDRSGQFEDAISAKEWCEKNLTCTSSVCWPHDKPLSQGGTPCATGEFCCQGKGGKWRKISTLTETKKDINWGVSSSARIIPILGGNPYNYIVAYKKDKLIKK